MSLCHIFAIKHDDSHARACNDYSRTACGIASVDAPSFIVTRMGARHEGGYHFAYDLAMCVECLRALENPRMRPAQHEDPK